MIDPIIEKNITIGGLCPTQDRKNLIRYYIHLGLQSVKNVKLPASPITTPFTGQLKS